MISNIHYQRKYKIELLLNGGFFFVLLVQSEFENLSFLVLWCYGDLAQREWVVTGRRRAYIKNFIRGWTERGRFFFWLDLNEKFRMPSNKFARFHGRYLQFYALESLLRLCQDDSKYSQFCLQGLLYWSLYFLYRLKNIPHST